MTPPATDELILSGNATATIVNGHGQHVAASDNAHINLTNSSGIVVHNLTGDITINTLGQNELHVSTPSRGYHGSVTINNAGSLLEGGVAGFGTNYTINGGLFANTGSSAGFDGQTTVVNADVVGRRTWQVSSYHSPGAGHLEFVRSVSEDQTVFLAPSIGYDHLQIDQPSQFHAAIAMDGKAAVDLVGLAADSYRYDASSGILDFYAGSNVIDSLRFRATLPDGFGVAAGTSTGSAGVEIFSQAGVPGLHHGAELPVHV